MTCIGLIGGMSWESTAEYYRLLNELTRERSGGLHSAEVLLYSVDFATIEQMQTDGRWAEAGDLLAAAARRLEAGGADLVLLCTNTMHKVAPAVQAAVGVPFVHLVDVTAEAVRASGLSRVGLIATRFTMEQGFYLDRMREHGIDVVVPDEDDRGEVHRVIYDELCLGVVRGESRARFVEIVSRLGERGVEGVVLGCTEVELLLRPDDVYLPVFASTRLHVEAALDLVSRPVPTTPS